MNSVLLIWEEVPESTKLYVIPEKEAAEYSLYLEMAHNKIINCDEMNDGLTFLLVALAENEESCGKVEEKFKPFIGCLRGFLVDGKYPLSGMFIQTVYRSGFML